MLCSVECKENNSVMRIRAVQALEKSGFIVYETTRNTLAMVTQRNRVVLLATVVTLKSMHTMWCGGQARTMCFGHVYLLYHNSSEIHFPSLPNQHFLKKKSSRLTCAAQIFLNALSSAGE